MTIITTTASTRDGTSTTATITTIIAERFQVKKAGECSRLFFRANTESCAAHYGASGFARRGYPARRAECGLKIRTTVWITWPRGAFLLALLSQARRRALFQHV